MKKDECGQGLRGWVGQISWLLPFSPRWQLRDIAMGCGMFYSFSSVYTAVTKFLNEGILIGNWKECDSVCLFFYCGKVYIR